MTFFELAQKYFPKRCREIPAIDGGILLQQIKVTKNCYLQHFVKPEPEGKFHIHRWKKMRSFILSGHYVEQRLYANRTTTEIRHRFGTTFSMDKGAVHRVAYWSPKCWTLFMFSGSDGLWGYLDKDFNYTPWDEYIPDDIRVDSL